jgi:lycopene cyclase domain-containing protein
MNPHYLYLIVDFLSILFPLAFSFYAKANFSKKWKYLWPAIAITATLFIIWDILFTIMGVWGFNPKYLIGIYIYNLPLEEILFFICIPYSCVFLYEALMYFINKDWLNTKTPAISGLLVAILLTIGVTHLDRWYTSVTFIATALLLALLQWKWRARFLSHFYLSFLVVLIPFFIVNGILTGGVTEEPVVWYNQQENLGIRIWTIPVEDIFYGMLLLIINISLFEYQQASGQKRVRS